MILTAYPILSVPERAVPAGTWPFAYVTASKGALTFTGDSGAFYITARDSAFYFSGDDVAFSITAKDSAFYFSGDDVAFYFEGENNAGV